MKNKQKKLLNLFDILLVILSVAFVGVAVFLFTKVLRYAEISMNLILAVLLVMVVLILVMITLCFSSLIFKKNKVLKSINLVLLVVLLIGGLYGGYILSSVNKNIDKIVQTDDEVTEKVKAYFIAFDNESAKDAGAEYLNGKTVGILSNDQILEGHIMPIEEIKRLNLQVEYQEYETYQELLFALFAKEVDIAAVAPSYASSFTEDDGQEENLKKLQLVYSYESEAKVVTSTNTNVDLTEPFTMLIIGVDSMNAGNSDVLMLATFNPNTLDITLTSIARDSFVPIACYGGSNNKINAARTTRQCLIDTVEDLMDTEINFYFETNFKGVVDIVDAVGGIVINSEVEFVGQNSSLERGNYTVWIPEGEYHANGEEVLAFIRERKAFRDGDFARQRHQKEVIRELLDKVLSMNNVSDILGILDAAGDNVSTNMSLAQIKELLSYCLQIFNSNYDKNSNIFDIQSFRVTGYSSWTYNTRLEMRLWIYKLFKGSLQDNIDIIHNNLELDKILTVPTSLNVDILNLYRGGKILPEVYNEKQEHEPMPAFVENFIGKSLAEMQTWANQHGLGLNIRYVKEGDEGYDSTRPDGTIVTQNVTSGRVALVSSIDIGVLKHPMDCSLSENMSKEECKNTYINAVDKNVDTIVQWANENGVTLSLNVIPSTDPGYDVTKAGYVKYQTEKAYSKFNSSKSLGITYYEKLSVTFLDALGQEIKDTKKSLVYGKTVKPVEYKCSAAEDVFAGWMNLANNQMFDFENTKVTSNLKLQAVCKAPKKHKVTFVYETATGTTNTVVEVITGKGATAPNASKTGFTYTWDKDFSNVVEDMTVTAIYIANTPAPTTTPETTPVPTPTPETTPVPTPTPAATPTPEAKPTPDSTPVEPDPEPDPAPAPADPEPAPDSTPSEPVNNENPQE